MEKFKWLFAIIGGTISAFSDKYGVILLFVSIAIVMDVITGLVKAKATGEGINSGKGTKGFWKKVALFVALFFGFFLDYFIPYMLGGIGIQLPINVAIFGMIIGCYIVINESISIVENLYEINPTILPKWVSKFLQSAKDQIDEADKKEK